jgi:hypothetical protein
MYFGFILSYRVTAFSSVICSVAFVFLVAMMLGTNGQNQMYGPATVSLKCETLTFLKSQINEQGDFSASKRIR